jgi:conjugative relaxase-like TrwC/TraI family protein
MIRMVQSNSASHAKAYFSDALAKSDYYLDDQELNGKVQGKLAERLGISGPATKEIFFALCDNTDPKTGKPLTPITREERRTGYDINFHCPKSVSILHALSKDDHLLKAFEQSVRETMLDIQADAMTRVRKDKKSEDRKTGELVWADFTHQTARPVDGSVPDPHLHAHCFVFNATWDEEEKRMKAAQFGDIKRDMPYYQARFHKRLSDTLMELGYQVRRTDKYFEVEGVPQKAIDLFSKRTDAIGRFAKEQNITDVKQLAELGARTRSKKQKGHSMAELKEEWKRQLRELEKEENGQGDMAVRFAPETQKQKILDRLTPEQCLDHALLHSFERASVLQDRRLLEAAYRHSLGSKSVSLSSVSDAFEADERIIHVKDRGRTMCTTRDVLREEKSMVFLARKSMGKLTPLYKEMPEIGLEGQQAEAVRHILTTSNRVSIVRGAAGTGKTTLMKEAVAKIEEAGKQVIVVAPTSGAAREVLPNEGFKDATTVASLLLDEKLQERLNGNVLWVDEAGLLGTNDMKQLLDLAESRSVRIILGGDTRQHSSVIRGDALRILNTVAGIKSAEVSRIYRQKNEQYRSAVQNLADGDIKTAFEKLDAMGVIQSIDPMQPHKKLVDDYVATIKKGKSALVVSPTHSQGDQVTEAIRTKLKKEGKLGKKELKASRLNNLNLTEAEKSDWKSFSEGQIIQFNQNVKGAKRGSIWTVAQTGAEGIVLSGPDGENLTLPTQKSKTYDAFEKKEIGLSKGDQIRLTRNGFDAKDKRLTNGQTLEVVSVKQNGQILLRHPQSHTTYEVDKEFGHLAHAYCVTSHASQGRTVDEVFIAQPAATFPATDAKQFYVSVSRGRDNVHIYTDDKEQLLEYASESGDRQSAMELVERGKPTMDYTQQRIRQDMERPPEPNEKRKDIEKERPTPSIDDPYEPV